MKSNDTSYGLIHKPYVVLFNTGEEDYILDQHTNRLFEISKCERTFFEQWLSGCSFEQLKIEFPIISDDLEKRLDEGLFSCRPPEKLSFRGTWTEIEKMITKKREKTLIEITNRCNLRCQYCTFGGGFVDHRNHGNMDIGKDILEKVIREAIDSSQESERISIGFYGGEPLLAFEKIKYAVSYAKTYTDRPVSFSLTTNGTLINKNIAEFLFQNDFTVLVSIDGPKDLHDRYRQYPDGTGSYEYTIQGLKTLLEVFPTEKQKQIGINMVIPSYSWMNQLNLLWEQELWLPRNLRAQTSIVDAPEYFEVDEPPIIENGISLYDQWLIEGENKRKNTLLNNLFDKSYVFFHQRPIFSGYRESFYPNGCCIPAVQKLYVTVEGDYKICERAHGCPNIGHALTGVDIDKVKNIINEYSEKSYEDCKSCIAISNCNLCYMHAYENGEYNQSKKQTNCDRIRHSFQQKVLDYIHISKSFPKKIEEWDRATIY